MWYVITWLRSKWHVILLWREEKVLSSSQPFATNSDITFTIIMLLDKLILAQSHNITKSWFAVGVGKCLMIRKVSVMHYISLISYIKQWQLNWIISHYTLESVKAKSKLCSTPMGVLEAYCMSLEDSTPQQYSPHMEQQVQNGIITCHTNGIASVAHLSPAEGAPALRGVGACKSLSCKCCLQCMGRLSWCSPVSRAFLVTYFTCQGMHSRMYCAWWVLTQNVMLACCCTFHYTWSHTTHMNKCIWMLCSSPLCSEGTAILCSWPREVSTQWLVAIWSLPFLHLPPL